jgi:CheY-like chemotaxis protein
MRKLLFIEDNEDNLYMLQLRFDVFGGYGSSPGWRRWDRDGGQPTTRSDPDGSGLAGDQRLGGDAAPQGRPGDVRHSDHRAERVRMAGDREKALNAGCDDFDTRPIEFDRLLAKIEQALAAAKRAS